MFSIPKRYWLIVFAAVLQGVLYTFIIPPWWHHDEPGHFEFIWQIAHFDHWPRPEEYDNDFRRELAQSLLDYNYYEPADHLRLPDLEHDDPIFIGPAPQTSEYPLYYLALSLPARWIDGLPYAAQNRILRLCSVLLYLGTLWLVWRTLKMLWPEEHPIVQITLWFLVLLPGFADIMTAINDDAGAVFAFSVFLYFSVRWWRQGASWKNLAGLLFGLALSFWTKTTAWIAFPLFLALFILPIFYRRPLIPLLLGAAALAWLSFGHVFQADMAQAWYPYGRRIASPVAPFGEHALQLAGKQPAMQVIPPTQIQALRGQTITIGAWMWADQPVETQLPLLVTYQYNGEQSASPHTRVTLTQTPTFYSQSWQVPQDAASARLILPRAANGEPLYYDNLIFIAGEISAASAPETLAAQNLARNPSFETGALRLVLPAVESSSLAHYAQLLNIFLASVQDWRGSLWHYRNTFAMLQQTFWAKPAGARIALPAAKMSYNLLQWFTFLGLSGAGLYAWRKRKQIHWPLATYLLLTVLLAWGLNLIRAGSSLTAIRPTTPWARYSMPAILPTALLLTAGWYEWLRLAGKLGGWRAEKGWPYLVTFFVSLDVYALAAIAITFYWRPDTLGFLFWLSFAWALGLTAHYLFKRRELSSAS